MKRKTSVKGILMVCLVMAGLAYGFHLPKVYAFVLLCYSFFMAFKMEKENGRQKEEYKDFLDLCVYIEQMLYNFKRDKKILTSLQETKKVFEDGKMKENISRCIDTILYEYKQLNAVAYGLEQIEKSYPNEKLKLLHRYLKKVEHHGGECNGTIEILLEDKKQFMISINLFLQEAKKNRINVIIATLVSIGICLLTFYVLPQDVKIYHYTVYKVGTAIFLMLQLNILYSGWKKTSISKMLYGQKKSIDFEEKMKSYEGYDEKKDKRLSFSYGALGMLIAIILLSFGLKMLAGIVAFISVMILNQHKIGRHLAKKTLTEEIKMSFPQWLMELSLLLQTNNVQVSIAESIESSPKVLKVPLQRMMEELKENPESVEPYFGFLKEFQISEISSAMKMIYGLSIGMKENATQQIKELLEQNQILQEQAMKMKIMDSLAGMYVIFLLPSLMGAFKLILDMTVFLIEFMKNLNL